MQNHDNLGADLTPV